MPSCPRGTRVEVSQHDGGPPRGHHEELPQVLEVKQTDLLPVKRGETNSVAAGHATHTVCTVNIVVRTRPEDHTHHSRTRRKKIIYKEKKEGGR